MSESNLLNDLAIDEISALARRPSIVVEMSPLLAFMVISHLQLAFRHPQNTGPSRTEVLRFAEGLRGQIARPGDPIDTLIAMGFDETFDSGR